MRVAFGLCLFVCTLAGNAFAQTSSGGSIRGYVKDEQDAVLPGVRLTATSPDVPVAPAATSDDSGYYRLLDLAPGMYTISAELDGFAKWVREGVVVRAGLNLSVPIVMKIGTLNETIQVKLQTPLVESKTATQAINISGDFQRELPLSSRRHWSNFISIAPGVITSNLGTQDLIHFHHGANFDANLAMVDGTDSTRAGQTSTLGINYSTEALADVQVITGGTDASLPLGTGVVVNAVTRSGTNQLHASGALVYQPARWNDSNVAGGTSPRTSIFQADLAAGGPLKPDVAWAFGSLRRNDTTNGLARTPQQIALLQSLVPSFRPFSLGNRATYYFLKPTFTIGQRHHGSGSFRHDVNPNESAAVTEAAVFSRSRDGGDTISGRLSSVWRGDVMTAIAASHTTVAASTELLTTDVPSRRVHAGILSSSGRTVGTGILATLDNRPSYSEVPDRKTTIAGDITISLKDHWGQHEVRGGVYLDRRHKGNRTRYPNGGFSLEEVVLRDPNNPAAGTAPFHRQIFDQLDVTLVSIDATNAAVYAQDSWRPSDRLTLTVGVRTDVVKQTDRNFDMSLQNSVDVSPSVGLNYSLTASHASSLRLSYTRRHEVLVFASAGSNAAGFRDLYDANLDGTFETVLVTPPSTVLAPDRVFDRNRHQPYAEDVNVGIRQQLPGNTLVDVGIFQRRFLDNLTLVEQNAIYEGRAFVGYRNPALNDVYLVTNNVWNWPVYRSIELQLSRQTARAQFLASYTRQWQHLAGTWQPNDPASFVQPGAFANARGIGFGSGSTLTSDANSLSGTSMAQTVIGSPWQDHVVNAAGSVKLWSGWFAAINYGFTSGPWSGPVVTRAAAPDPQFGTPTVRLPTGRVVSNPLATVLRFVGSTRSDGQFTLDSRHLVGVGVGRTTRVGGGATIRGMLQAFNLTNSDAGLFLASGGNQVFSPNYRQVSSRTAPRSLQASIRFEF